VTSSEYVIRAVLDHDRVRVKGRVILYGCDTSNLFDTANPRVKLKIEELVSRLVAEFLDESDIRLVNVKKEERDRVKERKKPLERLKRFVEPSQIVFVKPPEIENTLVRFSPKEMLQRSEPDIRLVKEDTSVADKKSEMDPKDVTETCGEAEKA
jgi:hypothetical protein